MLLHCAHARYVWNLAVEQHAHWRPGRGSAPGFAEQCRQLTEARRQRVAGGGERGRAAAGVEGLRRGQERLLHVRVR
ncbi:hypothetical protein ACWCPF_07025 [Streptomyces sp. NPDC001858]